jgi:hypothetical protein
MAWFGTYYSVEEFTGLESDTHLVVANQNDFLHIYATEQAAEDYLLRSAKFEPIDISIREAFDNRRRGRPLLGTYVIVAGVDEVTGMNDERQPFGLLPARQRGYREAAAVTVAGLERAVTCRQQRELATQVALTTATHVENVQTTFMRNGRRFSRMLASDIAVEVLKTVHVDQLTTAEARATLGSH